MSLSVDFRHLAEYADDFFEATDALFRADPTLNVRIGAVMSAEEVAEQRRLDMERSTPWGTPFTKTDEELADVILKFNEAAAGYMLRVVPAQDLQDFVPPARRTQEIADGFAAHKCPNLAAMFKP